MKHPVLISLTALALGASLFALSANSTAAPASPPAPVTAKAELRKSPAQVLVSAWDQQSFAVHEWGTFTSVSGSDGILLSGLQTEEEALPRFVSNYGSPSIISKGVPINYPVKGVTIKMETPVLYFYSPQAREISVDVRFQGGLITQWFPQAEPLGKSPFAITPMGLPFLPAGTPTLEFTPATSNAIHWPVHIYGRDDFVMPSTLLAQYETTTWNAPRATDANMIRSGVTPPKSDHLAPFLEADEKFLFYRGLGHFDIPLKTTADKDSVSLENTGPDAIPFALAWENGQIRWMGRLEAGAKASFGQQDELKDASLASLLNALIAAGLYRDEAMAMLTTWRASYFGSPGLRVFWIVPRAFTDRVLPLALSPAPQQLERVLVGRAEILTPALEAKLQEEAKLKPEEQQLLRSRYALPYRERLHTLKP